MKRFVTVIMGMMLFFIPISMVTAQNQIPNAGFENWTGNIPDVWVTTNIIGFYEPITQSTISNSGQRAAKGEVLSYQSTIIPPVLSSGIDVFDISQNYGSFAGYYQFINKGEDALFVSVSFFDAQRGVVAIGLAELGSTSGSYTHFALNMNYTAGTGQPAAMAFIVFSIQPASSSNVETASEGSYFLLDDLEFGAAVNSVEQLGTGIVEYRLAQNYPNPFNPATKISFSLPQSGNVKMTVFNIIGQEVATLLNENMNAGTHELEFHAGQLPSGIYYYQIETGEFQDVKRMILLK
jgi:hypothetical protein